MTNNLFSDDFNNLTFGDFLKFTLPTDNARSHKNILGKIKYSKNSTLICSVLLQINHLLNQLLINHLFDDLSK